MLIEIKAELLKNCPYGFEFYIGEVRYTLVYTSEVGVCVRSYLCEIESLRDTDTIVQVDADAYRDACIERIESVVGKGYKIQKRHGQAEIRKSGLPSYEGFVVIQAATDPWPHLEIAEWEAHNE